MPNRNSNYLTITTDTPEEMKAIVSVITRPWTDEFTLMWLNPMPEELDLPRSPIDIIPDGVDKLEHIKTKHAYLFMPEYLKSRTQEQSDKEISNRLKVTQRLSENKAIIAKYWSDDWSDWMRKYIWCKRDTHEAIPHSITDTEYCISFDTPRCPPNMWFENMCAKFPNAHFRMEYEEPGCAFQWTMESLGDWEFVNIEEDYVERCGNCDSKDQTTKYRKEHDDQLCDECNEHISKS